jgi:hypothetical protein
MGICKFCGKPTSYKKIGLYKFYWVCEECNKYRCKECGCFLHNRNNIGGLCEECWKEKIEIGRGGGEKNG